MADEVVDYNTFGYGGVDNAQQPCTSNIVIVNYRKGTSSEFTIDGVSIDLTVPVQNGKIDSVSGCIFTIFEYEHDNEPGSYDPVFLVAENGVMIALNVRGQRTFQLPSSIPPRFRVKAGRPWETQSFSQLAFQAVFCNFDLFPDSQDISEVT